MSRIAKPIETLLKLKQIKPDLVFEGADALAYQEFIEAQAEENLIATIKKEKETTTTTKKKTTTKRRTKKVKQTIDPEIVETGEVKPNETIDNIATEEIQSEEENN